MLKISKFCRHLLIYGLGFFVAFSGLMLVSIPQASAKASVTETKKELNVEKINFDSPICSTQDGIYYPGQKIKCSFSFGEVESAWAQIGDLDPNFPEIVNLVEVASGVWQFQTPALTSEINTGSHLIKVFVSDAEGRVFTQNIKIVLKNLSSIVGLSMESVEENTATVTWKNIGMSDTFLINWQAQVRGTSESALTSGKINTFKIKDLKPETSYKVTIWPLYNGQKGISASQNFQTLAITNLDKAVKSKSKNQIAATQITSTTVTPAIGEGVSTSAPVITRRPVQAVAGQTEPKVAPVTPQISPSPSATSSPTPSSEAKTQTGGWNKLLVALSILIIAAGAAIGGYYGYEWLVLRGKDDDEETPTKSSNRW